MVCPFLVFVLKCGRGVLEEDSKLSKCKKFENHHRSILKRLYVSFVIFQVIQMYTIAMYGKDHEYEYEYGFYTLKNKGSLLAFHGST